jgi:hypothetical protein
MRKGCLMSLSTKLYSLGHNLFTYEENITLSIDTCSLFKSLCHL